MKQNKEKLDKQEGENLLPANMHYNKYRRNFLRWKVVEIKLKCGSKERNGEPIDDKYVNEYKIQWFPI